MEDLVIDPQHGLVRGISTLTQGDLDTLIQMADDNHTQVGIHAIGDTWMPMRPMVPKL